MYGQPSAVEAATIWWALVIGLLVQAVVIYGCFRLALIHHHRWLQAQAKSVELAVRWAAAHPNPVVRRGTDDIVGAPND